MSDDDNLFVTDARLKNWIAGRGWIAGKQITPGGGGSSSGADTIEAFQEVLQNAIAQRVVIAVLGDSISYGNYSSVNTQADLSHPATSYVGVLATALQTKYGDGGSGFSPNYYDSNATINAKYPTTNNRHVNWTAGPGGGAGWTVTKDNTARGYLGNVKIVPSNGSKAQFLTRGKHVVVYYGVPPSTATTDSFTVSIDGTTTTVTVDVNAATNPVMREATFDVTGTGIHTVIITASSSPTTSINGVCGFNDTGVVVNNISTPGMLLSSYGSVTALGAANSWTYSFLGYSTSNGAALTPSLKADALILEFGLNDANTPVDTDLVLDPLVTASIFWRNYAGTPVNLGNGKMMPLMYVQSAAGAWSTDSDSINRLTAYSDYCAAFNALAQQYNAVYVDLTKTYNSYVKDKANGYYFNDTVNTAGANSNATDLAQAVHMGDLGHAAMGNIVLKALDPTFA